MALLHLEGIFTGYVASTRLLFIFLRGHFANVILNSLDHYIDTIGFVKGKQKYMGIGMIDYQNRIWKIID